MSMSMYAMHVYCYMQFELNGLILFEILLRSIIDLVQVKNESSIDIRCSDQKAVDLYITQDSANRLE